MKGVSQLSGTLQRIGMATQNIDDSWYLSHLQVIDHEGQSQFLYEAVISTSIKNQLAVGDSVVITYCRSGRRGLYVLGVTQEGQEIRVDHDFARLIRSQHLASSLLVGFGLCLLLGFGATLFAVLNPGLTRSIIGVSVILCWACGLRTLLDEIKVRGTVRALIDAFPR